MDLILRNARIAGRDKASAFDIGIENGRIAVIAPRLEAEGREMDLEGRLVTPPFVESHIHLDKSNILDRCSSDRGDLEEAIGEVARVKREFTAEDVYERAKRTLERCIAQGTMHMRTHLEVDPVVGLRSLEGVLPLIDEYRWAIDIELCIFPQEGLLNNPGTDELMIAALKRGGTVVGAAPYTDSDPHGQIDRVFAIAREFDVDIDMHLDFAPTADDMDLVYVCDRADTYRYGGRVAIGHVTKMSAATPDTFKARATRMADSGVALTVLPSTDLYLMGRHMEHSIMRGVTPAHKLLHCGVNCSLATNNVLNPFTPFGDCSPIRMANLYANIAHVGARGDVRECFNMVTERAAQLMRLKGYGITEGAAADLLVFECEDREAAVAQIVAPLYGFKRGRHTFTRPAAELHRPP